MKKYFLSNKSMCALFLFISMIGALSVVFMAYIINLLVQSIVELNLQKLIIASVYTLIYIFIDSFLDYYVEIVNERLSQRMIHQLRTDITVKLQQTKLGDLEEINQEYYTNMLTNDLEIVERDYIKELLSMYNDVWTFIFGLVSAMAIQPYFTVIMIGMSLLPLIIPKISNRILEKVTLSVSDAQAEYLAGINDFLKGMKVLKLYQAFSKYQKILDVKSKQLEKTHVNHTHVTRSIYALSYGVREAMSLLTWIVGGLFIIQGSLAFSTFFTIKQLINYVSYPIQGFTQSYTEYLSAKSVVNKILTFIETDVVEEYSINGTVEKKGLLEEIILSDVTIKNQGETILENVNLNFERYKKYLIVGESGGGKTTLIKMIMGLHNNYTGGITYKNSMGNYLTVEEVFQHYLSYVSQDTTLFSQLTIKENMTLLNEYTIDKLETALKKAGLNGWNSAETDRLNQLLSFDQMVSGGEKKRIDLVRLFLQNRGLWILDEPSNGLDVKLREQVEKNILSIHDDKVLIYISHIYDKQTLAYFDEVVTVQNKSVQKYSVSEYQKLINLKS